MFLPRWVRRIPLQRIEDWLHTPRTVPTSWNHPVASDELDYARWAELQPSPMERLRTASTNLDSLRSGPLFSILMPVHDPELSDLKHAIASVEDQIYPHWELCVADDASTKPRVIEFLRQRANDGSNIRYTRLPSSRHIAGATNVAIAQATGEFVAFLDHDDELTPDALLEVAAVIRNSPETDIVYSDHDVLGADGALRAPCFKPDWCPELLTSYMYLGHLKVYRTSLVRELGGMREGFEGSADYDLALRLTERTDRIRHIPKILYHW